MNKLAIHEPEDSPFGPVIYSYSRAQAIADGVLVDVTETARETGFKLPVAITDAFHSRLTPTRADRSLGQDYDGRLWDVLWLAAFTLKLVDPGTDTVSFIVVLQEMNSKSGRGQNSDLRLQAVCSPGDMGEPVVTIGFPEDF